MNAIAKLKKEFRDQLLKAEAFEKKLETDPASVTDEDRKTFTDSLAVMESLKADIQSLEAKAQMDAFAGEKPAENKGITFEEQSGEELIGKNEKGDIISIEAAGYGLSEKQFRFISEKSYKKDFMELIRSGATPTVMKAMQEGLDVGGGYLVPPDMQNRIIMRKPHPTSILSAINTIGSSRDRVLLPVLEYTTDDIYSSGVRITWTGETGESAEDTALDSSWGQKEIAIHTGAFEIHVSRDLLEDAMADVESIIVKEAQKSYKLGMDDVVVNGNGVAKPRGLLANPGETGEPPTDNIGNPTTYAELVAFVYGMPPQYAENAKMLVNRTSVYATWAQIVDAANNSVFGLMSNTDGGMARARLDTIFGHDMLFSAFMPAAAGAAKVAVFGDFDEAYTHVRRVGLSVVPFAEGDREMRKQNKQGFYFRFRSGGAVVQPRALRVGVQS